MKYYHKAGKKPCQIHITNKIVPRAVPVILQKRRFEEQICADHAKSEPDNVIECHGRKIFLRRYFSDAAHRDGNSDGDDAVKAASDAESVFAPVTDKVKHNSTYRKDVSPPKRSKKRKGIITFQNEGAHQHKGQEGHRCFLAGYQHEADNIQKNNDTDDLGFENDDKRREKNEQRLEICTFQEFIHRHSPAKINLWQI